MRTPATYVDDATLKAWVTESRQTTRDMVEDLSDRRRRLPYLVTVLPTEFELGHVAWFQERWVLRNGGVLPSLLTDADPLFDSASICHEARWSLEYPDRQRLDEYLEAVLSRVLEKIDQGLSDELRYLTLLSLFHEDQHAEALLYTRQALGECAPTLGLSQPPGPETGSRELVSGEAEIPGGTFLVGADPGEGFVFDNEKWAHEVTLEPLRMDRRPVSETEFAAFVEENGYDREELWSKDGWRWRIAMGASTPIYWRVRPGQGFERRRFNEWRPLRDDHAVRHVCWYEAEAWCRWAGRRLPTEFEWERVASGIDGPRRRHPWGDTAPGPEHACLDFRSCDGASLRGGEAGASDRDVRHLVGHVWEWTASSFQPYPGFAPDAYKEYSEPWFGVRRVLRGGSHATRGRMLRNSLRNFFTPDRRDVFAGFRSCATND